MRRNNSLDLLRIISTIAVIVIHSNAHYLFADGIDTRDTYYWIGTIINTFMRFSVPAFVMISGAFNICEKNEDIRSFYTKSFKKVFLPMIPIILILYSVIAVGYIVVKHEFIKPLMNFITGGIYAYWFMYMLLFLYILTPFVVVIKRNISPKIFKFASIFLLIWACFSQAMSSQKSGNTMGVVFAFMGYYMVGNVIYEESQEKPQKSNFHYLLLSVVFFAFASCIRICGFSYYNYDQYVSFFSPAVIVASVYLFKWFCSIRVDRNFVWLSSKTFYIYLFHDIILEVLFPFLDRISAVNALNIIIAVTLTFVFSLIGAILYSKIWDIIYAKMNMK